MKVIKVILDFTNMKYQERFCLRRAHSLRLDTLAKTLRYPLICHFAGIIRKNGYPLWISVLSEMVEISGFEPLTS